MSDIAALGCKPALRASRRPSPPRPSSIPANFSGIRPALEDYSWPGVHRRPGSTWVTWVPPEMYFLAKALVTAISATVATAGCLGPRQPCGGRQRTVGHDTTAPQSLRFGVEAGVTHQTPSR